MPLSAPLDNTTSAGARRLDFVPPPRTRIRRPAAVQARTISAASPVLTGSAFGSPAPGGVRGGRLFKLGRLRLPRRQDLAGIHEPPGVEDILDILLNLELIGVEHQR